MNTAQGLLGLALAGAMAIAGMPAAFAAIDEEEPNGSFETATTISMGETVYGTFDGDYYEDDFYKVVLPQNGSVRLTAANGKRSDAGAFYYDVYNQHFKKVGSYDEPVDLDVTGSVNQSFSLTRGTYYFRFYADADAGHPYHFSLSYVVPGTSVSSLASGKKSFTAKWVKKSGAASYQVRYTPASTYKLYGWDKAKVNTVSKKKTSVKVTGLKAKKRYYVQVRVSKKIGDKTYWSSWTGKRSVATR